MGLTEQALSGILSLRTFCAVDAKLSNYSSAVRSENKLWKFV
jgi:hypothetical protein